MKKMEDSPCLLSLLLYRPNLKNIYETRPFKAACTGCTKNGCNIIWAFAGNIIFLLYIKKACPTLSLNYRKRSKRNILLPIFKNEPMGRNNEVSGAGEPPPCALSDTDVNLSAHPAPIIQPSVLCPTANAEITRAAFWQCFPTKKPHSLDGISTFSISSLPI